MSPRSISSCGQTSLISKTKLDLFGGKLSTLFNAYLREFVDSMDKEPYSSRKEIDLKLKELEKRLEKIENVN